MNEKVLIATRNLDKLNEYIHIFSDLNLEWLSLADLMVEIEVEETGITFEENAILKAKNYAAASGYFTLADDSGLEVEALGGLPGVHTARYGGNNLSTAERYHLLLKELDGVPWKKRIAYFHCVIALARPGQIIGTASGSCQGMIAMKPAGLQGFGYDPVFYLPDKNLTMAQLADEEKHGISHRGRALAAIEPLLRSQLDLSGKSNI